MTHIGSPVIFCDCGDLATEAEMCADCAAEELEILRAFAAGGPDGGHVEAWPDEYEYEQVFELVPFDDYQIDEDGNAYPLEGEDE